MGKFHCYYDSCCLLLVVIELLLVLLPDKQGEPLPKISILIEILQTLIYHIIYLLKCVILNECICYSTGRSDIWDIFHEL